jgi:hypothetical protein
MLHPKWGIGLKGLSRKGNATKYLFNIRGKFRQQIAAVFLSHRRKKTLRLKAHPLKNRLLRGTFNRQPQVTGSVARHR